MKKLIPFIGLVLCAFSVSAQADSTKIIHDFANHLSMSIPGDVNVMNAEQIRVKYHKAKDETTNFYGSEDMSFSIVVSVVAPGNVKEEDMVKHKAELLAAYKSKHKLLTEEVRTVNKHKLIVVSFYSDVTDGKVLNKQIFGVVNQKLVSVEFNATEAELLKRNPQMEACINSIVIK
ncbi:hypothetical protein [Ferruginibacter sp. SUN106]|uniref:hypothetical protein n=1 Tax=Ferruginibacter sp. SUN106 TaxID=2978348 RepID=UPI003D365E6B